MNSGQQQNRQPPNGADGFGVTLVAFAAILIATAVYAIVRIVDMPTAVTQTVGSQAEIVRNIGLFLLGVIGLPLAIWRSWIAKQQVDEAIAQGERTERQLRHAERQLRSGETTALLGIIEKGGSLLAEDKIEARVTGVHLLSGVVNSDIELLRRAASEILYSFVSERGRNGELDHFAACHALLEVVTRQAREETSDYRKMRGDNEIRIHLDNAELSDLVFRNPDTNFYDCTVKDCFSVHDVKFENCGVSRTLILGVSKESIGNRFEDCDFSFCSVPIHSNNEFMKCFYHTETPPSAEVIVLFGDRLEARPGRSPHFPES